MNPLIEQIAKMPIWQQLNTIITENQGNVVFMRGDVRLEMPIRDIIIFGIATVIRMLKCLDNQI